jgi:hypothetical protein
MSPLGEQLAGNKRVLLSAAQDQPGYDVNDSQYCSNGCLASSLRYCLPAVIPACGPVAKLGWCLIL